MCGARYRRSWKNMRQLRSRRRSVVVVCLARSLVLSSKVTTFLSISSLPPAPWVLDCYDLRCSVSHVCLNSLFVLSSTKFKRRKRTNLPFSGKDWSRISGSLFTRLYSLSFPWLSLVSCFRSLAQFSRNSNSLPLSKNSKLLTRNKNGSWNARFIWAWAYL